ncbi:MAG: hypothetical protein ABI925_10610 [Verrucomicrobiota bacterium]
MKNVLTFLIGALIGVGAIYLYHKFDTNDAKTTFCLELNIKDGQRVELKDPGQIKDFEKALETVDPGGANGTMVDIKPAKDSPDEEEGPLTGGAFKAPNRLIGPAASVHNTQKIYFNTHEQLDSIMAFFASTSVTTRSSPANPTPTPSPTP